MYSCMHKFTYAYVYIHIFVPYNKYMHTCAASHMAIYTHICCFIHGVARAGLLVLRAHSSLGLLVQPVSLNTTSKPEHNQ